MVFYPSQEDDISLLTGVLHNQRAHGLRGAQAIPHRQFWRELGGLVEDGVGFVRSRGRAKGRGGARLLPSSGAGEKSGKPRRKEKREKKEKKNKSQRESRGLARGDSVPGRNATAAGGSAGTRPEVESASAGPRAGAGPSGTAAGDGGRWVHVK